MLRIVENVVPRSALFGVIQEYIISTPGGSNKTSTMEGYDNDTLECCCYRFSI